MSERLKKSAFSSGPKRLPISDLLDTQIDFRGRTPKKLGMDWGGGDIAALSAKNVRMGKVDLSLETYYGSEKLYERWMTTGDPQRGDVLLTMEAPLGNVAQIPDDQRYLLSQRVVLLRFNQNLATNDFMAAQMRGDAFQREIARRSTGTTATGIQRAELERVVVSLPPLDRQRRIAEILSTVDEAIEHTEAMIAKTQQIKTGLMHDLFTRGVTPDGRLRPPRDQAPELYKESPLGWIPREWEVVPLRSVVDIERGFAFRSSDYRESGILNFRVSNLETPPIEIRNRKYLPPAFWDAHPKQRLFGGEIVIVMVGATTGKIGRVPPDLCPALLNQNLWNLQPLGEIDDDFLWYSMPDIVNRHMQMSQGSARDFLKQRDFGETLVVLPGNHEQAGVVLASQPVDERLESDEETIRKLRMVRYSLSCSLLTGQLTLREES